MSKITTIARPALTSDHFTASAGLAAAGESRWLCEGAAAGRESERRRPEYYTWCLDQGLFAHTGAPWRMSLDTGFAGIPVGVPRDETESWVHGHPGDPARTRTDAVTRSRWRG